MKKWSKILALSTGLLGVTTPVLMAAGCKSASPEDNLATEFVIPNSVFKSVTKEELVANSNINIEDIYDTFIEDESSEEPPEKHYFEIDFDILKSKIQEFENENGKITTLRFNPGEYMKRLNYQEIPTFFYAKKGFWKLFPDLKKFSRGTRTPGEYGLLVTNFDKGYDLDDLPEGLEEIYGFDKVRMSSLKLPPNLKIIENSFNNLEMAEETAEITIPSNLKTIRNSFNNSKIKKIKISKNSQLDAIRSSFSGNKDLNELPELPNTLETFNSSFEWTQISEMVFSEGLTWSYDILPLNTPYLHKVEIKSTPEFFHDIDLKDSESPEDDIKNLFDGNYERYYDLFNKDGKYREIMFIAPQQIVDYIKIGIESAYNSYSHLDSGDENAEKAAKIKENYPDFADLINENNEDSKPVTLKIYENDLK